MRRPSVCVALTFAFVAVAGPGCKNRDLVAAPLPAEEAPRRAANSFIHCVESGTSQCVRPGETVGGWDAFFLLTWLGGGSPLSILGALPNELSAHADPKQVQHRFVEEVERYAIVVRGAECDAADMQPIEPLIDQVGAVAAQRLERLGMWQGNMSQVVDGLVKEARETMKGGFLVRMDCAHDPHRLWVATVERDETHRVIGMTTLLPHFLGGQPPGRKELTDRLNSRSLGLSAAAAPVQEGTVHPWISVPVEVF
jgi:hypothetical protein